MSTTTARLPRPSLAAAAPLLDPITGRPNVNASFRAVIAAVNASSAPAPGASVKEIIAYRMWQASQSPQWMLVSLLALLCIWIALDVPRMLARILGSIANSSSSAWSRIPDSVKGGVGIQHGQIPATGEIGEGLRLRAGTISVEDERANVYPQRARRSSSIGSLFRRESVGMEKIASARRQSSRFGTIAEDAEDEEEKEVKLDKPRLIAPPMSAQSSSQSNMQRLPVVTFTEPFSPRTDSPELVQPVAERPMPWRPTFMGRRPSQPGSFSQYLHATEGMDPRGSDPGYAGSPLSGTPVYGDRRRSSAAPLMSSDMTPSASIRSMASQDYSPASSLFPINIDQAGLPASARVPPPHVTSLMQNLPYCNKFLLWTPFPQQLPHMTLAGICLTGLYIMMVCIAVFYKSNLSFDVLTNPAGPDWFRSGCVALGQVPLAVGLGGRNSIVRMLLGGGENAAIQRIHKLVGRSIFVCILIHMGLYWHKWLMGGIFATASRTPFIVAGYISTLALLILVITSFPYFRQRFHGVFMVSHYLGMAGFLIGLALHVPVAVPWVVASAILVVFEHVCRFAKMRWQEAELVPLPGALTTVIRINGLREGWRAGQYVVLRIPSLAGKIGIQAAEGHPFTIASAPNARGLVLMAKAAGDWTNAVYDMARAANPSLEKGAITGIKTKVIVEGPYGGPGHTLFTSYGSVMLVGGGSGITFPLGVARDLIRRSRVSGAVRARNVDLVWIVRTQDIARPMVSELRALVEEAEDNELERYGEDVTALRVRIFVSRAPASTPFDILGEPSLERKQSFDTIKSRNPSVHFRTRSCIQVTGQRPNMREIVAEAVADTSAAARFGPNRIPQGCGMAVCGPTGLVTDIRRAVECVSESDRVAAGGVELHEEFFAV